MRVLVTGISGKLGRRVALRLVEGGHEVLGIDRRPWADAPPGVEVHQTDIRKRQAEDVFRIHEPEAVVHMATVTHITQQNADRYRINLQGTRAVVDHCHRYGVKRLVFVGRHTYYGAAPDSPLYHSEDEPPLGMHAFPELADLVAADLYAGSALWRHPEIATSVLRMVYTLGPSKHGTLAEYLRGPRVPVVLGFDPLFQFMHEFDAASAVAAALEAGVRGVFNVAGPAPMPLSAIIKEAGRTPMPVPEGMLAITLGRFGMPYLPKGAVEHLKYPIIVDATAFRKATGFQHAYDESETIRAFAEAD
ncbi:MAG: SDR family oxidoreductase [Myxococcales bacterium]|jgi:UDP-glucose 4-epimerase|nr:SDR family oxidoreductase [Myxococcales bacterium]